MAFSSSSKRGTDIGYNLNEKAQGSGNEGEFMEDKIADLNSRDWNLNEKAEDSYHNEEREMDITRRFSSERHQPHQPLSGRAGPSGDWGTGFWKDNQPTISTKEMQYVSSYKDVYGMSEEELPNREQVEVSAEEMVSDEYYEQDTQENSNYQYRGALNHPSTSSSRVLAASSSARQPTVGRVNSVKYKVYGGEEDNTDEEEEEDDPDDVDFEPDYNEFGKGDEKDDALGSENSGGDNVDEDEDNDNDLEPSDEEDVIKYQRPVKRPKVVRNVVIREKKSSPPRRRKRGRSVSDDEYSSERGSGEYKDAGFASQSRQSLKSHKTIEREVFQSDQYHVNGLRTSGRSVRKISYVESDDSNEEKSGKPQVSKEDLENDDGETIERVLWHQPKGTAEVSTGSNQSTQPSILSMSDLAPTWDDVEFYIKWKGQSYLHCEWKTISDLQNLSGFKKVLNYMKKFTEEARRKRSLSREEAEVHDVTKEMELDLIKHYSLVERIFADRINKTSDGEIVPEYLVKWQGLPYAESTWEKDTDIACSQDAIDEYKARESSRTVQGKTVDFQRKKSKGTLRRLDEQPEWLRGGKLRDYQLEGLNFLVNGWRNDTNVILADEMGLGKTIQAVSMLGFLQNAQEIRGAFLVVVPLSTLTNWAREFRKWLPEMNVVVYVGNRASREMCQQYEFYINKNSGQQIKFDTLITTYEVVLKDKLVLSKIRWNYLVVDEAHRLKNCEASLYTSLLEFHTKNKLLITGTPLQNSVEELWALLHFLDSQKFNSKDTFVERYKNLSSFNESELSNLHKELRPHILRRVIKDVEKSLPPKIERILRVDMSPLQKQYYKWILERNFQSLNKGVRGNQVSLLNIVVELKKCCNHPFLFESADHGYGGDTSVNDHNKIERIIMSSGKLVLLDKLLVRLRETNHRVLIFSQMVRMLDILAEYLSLRGFQFQRLDGSTRADLRHQAMEHFNAPGSDDFCFLLSTRAGGLGINLATADTVIIFDSDWNPQNDLQAMSRAHRIGQQETVNIYRFVTSKSVEEDILERAKKKMVLDHLVIQKLNAEGRLEKKETKKGGSMFDKNELSAILRFGAEELFKEDKNDDESKRYLESVDIDEILERAEKVESKDPEAEAGNELLSAFKVANFCSAEDDATFWSRLIQPEPVEHIDEALAPRAARSNRSYAEDLQPENNSRKRKVGDSRDKSRKRPTRGFDSVAYSLPLIEGASAQVRDWSYGGISKREASQFVRAVKKFGNPSQIDAIAAEVGSTFETAPAESQLELFNLLIDGCREAAQENNDVKGTILDFFGVSVKAYELLSRVEELQLLAKRIARYKDPVKQFRLMTQHKIPQWSKSCGWSSVDDARLLLGIHYHGYGNWEKIRLDTKLGLAKKIAPASLGERDTFLPRAPNLDNRAGALLQKEFTRINGKNLKAVKGSLRRTVANSDSENTSTVKKGRQKDTAVKTGGGINRSERTARDRPLKQPVVQEPEAKEEGEISDSETENWYRQNKEEKWAEWCGEVMEQEEDTLQRLQRLQTTSVDLPKEKVLSRIRKYLRLIGRKIDQIVQQHGASYKQHRMTMRLWNYVSNFSNMTGERLFEIYSKLKDGQADCGVGPSYSGSFAPGFSNRDTDAAAAPVGRRSRGHMHSTSTSDNYVEPLEPWKRRRRANKESAVSSSYEHNAAAGDVSAGILGRGPMNMRPFSNGRPQRTQSGARFHTSQK